MEIIEIIKHIDDGANFYLRLLGDAKHMEYLDNGYLSCRISPILDNHLVSFLLKTISRFRISYYPLILSDFCIIRLYLACFTQNK